MLSDFALSATKATVAQCSDDVGAFQLDTSATTITPNPLEKGTTCAFGLRGVVTETINVNNLHVHVDWNQSPLYDEDHSQDNTYTSEYSYDLNWEVPGFAPDGHYDILFTATDANQKTNLCVKAQFDF